MREHLQAIRDYVENPAAVSAEWMTNAEKINGMYSQAVAALEAPAPIPVFSIVLLSNALHRVEIAAATEMSFDFRTQPNDDYDKVIEALCHLAPAMMRVDAALMEMMDGTGERPKQADLALIHAFVKKYRARLENVNVGMSGFRGL